MKETLYSIKAKYYFDIKSGDLLSTLSDTERKTTSFDFLKFKCFQIVYGAAKLFSKVNSKFN